MKYISKELNDWAIDKIKKEFPEDIALLIGHEHWKIAPDGDEIAFNFFVPSTERGYDLSQTFIIDEIGYDLFPMSWDRLGEIANLNESLTTCLADGVILYSRNEEDKDCFIKLQEKLQNNLKTKKLTYMKGLEKINRAMELFQNMLFENSLRGIRKASGFAAHYLVEAIAAVNGSYLQRGPENVIAKLSELEEIPDGFVSLYENLVTARTIEESKDICYKMLTVTRNFFSIRKPEKETQVKEYDYEYLAEWYQEITYWFRRIYYYCDIKDTANGFAWGCSIQRELDFATEEFGLETMELINIFDSQDLSIFRKRAEEIEKYLVSAIEKHNVKIQKFKNLNEFLKQNG